MIYYFVVFFKMMTVMMNHRINTVLPCIKPSSDRHQRIFERGGREEERGEAGERRGVLWGRQRSIRASGARSGEVPSQAFFLGDL